jgi:MFS family permease
MKTSLWLSLIIALRFLGLFIVLPMLSLYAYEQIGSSTFLIGLAIGGYAITQMLFQYPLGKLSDKIGRRWVIVFGLLLFIVGSIVAALSEDIYMLIVGRLLQGAGAISSTITAMISDFTKEEERSKAMALMGGAIAMSFVVSMIFGPLIGGYFGVETLFEMTAILAFIAIIIIIFKVPNPPKIEHNYTEVASLKTILRNSDLFRMDIIMFFHSFLMTIAFLMIPLTLVGEFGWEKSALWQVYLPAITLGFLFMGLAAMLGEAKEKTKLIFQIAIVFFGLSFLFFGLADNSSLFIIGVVLFFIGFMMLEPLLQSSVSKIARIHERGAALGVFNSFQFLGVFIGGVVGGSAIQYFGMNSASLVFSATTIIWFTWVWGMKNPKKSYFSYHKLETTMEDFDKRLEKLTGVEDYYINQYEKLLVIKYDKLYITDEDLKLSLKKGEF